MRARSSAQILTFFAQNQWITTLPAASFVDGASYIHDTFGQSAPPCVASTSPTFGSVATTPFVVSAAAVAEIKARQLMVRSMGPLYRDEGLRALAVSCIAPTMCRWLLFTVAAACSSAIPAKPLQAVVTPAAPTPDAPEPAPVASALGSACPCRGDLSCLPLPGGYCGSSCDTACDGSCVETGRAGEVCMKACSSDADCRTDEGYVCDLEWRACSVP